VGRAVRDGQAYYIGHPCAGDYCLAPNCAQRAPGWQVGASFGGFARLCSPSRFSPLRLTGKQCTSLRLVAAGKPR